MEDMQIVELFWQRDESAIRETAEKYGVYCHAIANNILQDNEDAGECVNDTWLKTRHAIPPQRPKHLKLFLAKITRNLAINRLEERKAGKRGGNQIFLVLDELEECIGDADSVEDALVGEELRQTIDRFVHRLPERDCDIFVRRYFFTESIGEIAARYQMTENHVTVVLSRTRRKLKAYLRQEGYCI